MKTKIDKNIPTNYVIYGRKSQDVLNWPIHHIHFDCIDSTNNWAKQHMHMWPATGIALVTANQQTAGRGRLKRTWVSPSNVNIYASFCFWIDHRRSDIGNIPQLLALSVTQMLHTQGCYAQIKWPNDVLVSGKKISGILCETQKYQEMFGVICGVGINVNMTQDLLQQIDRVATSLYAENGQNYDISLLLQILQDFFIAQLQQFILHGFAQFFPLFQQKCAFEKSQIVQFHDGETIIKAQFEQLSQDGWIQLRLPNGTSKRFFCGEFVETQLTQ